MKEHVHESEHLQADLVENRAKEGLLEGESLVASQSVSKEQEPEIVALKEHITVLEKKAEENWDKALRALSEVENIRRRSDKELDKARKYAIESFAESLLPVIDSLEHALQLESSTLQPTAREGLELTLRLFMDALNKHQLVSLEPLGEPFNPAQHEAMSMREEVGVKAGTILHVFQKGYLLSGRVLRPARVIVAKEAAETTPS